MTAKKVLIDLRRYKERSIKVMYYAAIDIGASSGRVMLSSLENGKMTLEEVHRFPNGMTMKMVNCVGITRRFFAK